MGFSRASERQARSTNDTRLRLRDPPTPPRDGGGGHVKCMFHVLAGMKSEFVAMAQAHWISCYYLNRTAGATLRDDVWYGYQLLESQH